MFLLYDTICITCHILYNAHCTTVFLLCNTYVVAFDISYTLQCTFTYLFSNCMFKPSRVLCVRCKNVICIMLLYICIYTNTYKRLIHLRDLLTPRLWPIYVMIHHKMFTFIIFITFRFYTCCIFRDMRWYTNVCFTWGHKSKVYAYTSSFHLPHLKIYVRSTLIEIK